MLFWQEFENENCIVNLTKNFMGGESVGKYSDDDIRNCKKITCKIAADYLGIAPMAVSIGMRNELLPIGFAIKSEDRGVTILLMKG